MKGCISMKKITKFLSIIISICVISSMASFNVLAEDAQTASTIVTTTAIHSWQLDGNNNANKLEDITSATTNIIAKSVNNRYPIYEFELPNKEAVKSVKFVTTPTYLGSTSANYVHLYAANLDNVTAKTYDSMLEVVNNAKTSAISYYNTINKTDNEINNHEKIGIEAGIDPTNKTTLYQPYQEWATERGNITEKTAEFDITDYVKQEEVYGKTLGVII